MALAIAQGRSAADIRDALKTEPFYGDSIKEVGSFLAHITDLMIMNGWTYKMLNATPPAGGGN